MLQQNEPNHILKGLGACLAPNSMHGVKADKRQPGLRHYLLLLLVQNTQNPNIFHRPLQVGGQFQLPNCRELDCLDHWSYQR